ncbi:solute carrier family 13 (sodium-dependent dicarboxylate transporter), member 2/3/5 [Pustulibacterium marinum]|uniref:Solute carrier family 13 (Sodium-dependent dicarboxylate transporter), member 2/3/5 n=1 Tax=Pustulibacterium marinum TaxID=1224947 RepID=A0A1I7HLB4_9FLAO|nr:SLC13 family permease [Pustulibacterium marinum]SFU61495.1 solute carrier family 13 (sodium-dependent dicarboxylate transporter), member 2/3/5 [Pustulibacterium marinum]
MKLSKKIGLVLGPLAFLIVHYLFYPEGLSTNANSVLAVTVWIAIWWITEAIPIAVTSLLPIVLFPLTEGLSISETTASYGHKYIFLYMGGFMIALAIEKWNLHKRIALNIIHFIGANIQKIILGFMIATAFLSMWISNTATSVMMLPIAMAIITQLKDNPNSEINENKRFGKALMLAIAYSASIGGIATLIGTPPNLVLAGVVQNTYHYEITFMQWFLFGFPVAMILLTLCYFYITKVAFKFQQTSFPGGKQEIKRLKNDLGIISFEEKAVGFIFGFTALCWILRSFVLKQLLPGIDDTIIAIGCATLLFMVPSKEHGKRLMSWKDAEKLPWGIILLFGGGMALAHAFEVSGLAEWIGNKMTSLNGFSLFMILLILVASMNFLTEITSNTATTAMLLPVLAPMALTLDIHPLIIMTGAAVAASCAFMLPVATPPNAVVFGSGYLKISDMVKKGFILNVISIILVTVFVYYLIPFLWDINPNAFPSVFKIP